MAKLVLTNLSKTYAAKVTPIKNLNLTVEDRDFLTLLGPSGCGKSTILRLIAGLEQPTQGQVTIGDRNVTRLGAGDRNIAMVFQSYALYPHMTVYDNMASGLKLRKMADLEIRQRIHNLAKLLGLEDLLERKPSQLSGGQRQRVAVGRALVRQPDVFLLDEPLSNLDALLRERVRAELKELFANQEAPVVYVTHDQTEAMTLSTRVAVLSNGNLQQLDSPQQIYNYPANQFVASFVGSPQMNLLTLPCCDGYASLGEARLPLPQGLTTPPNIVFGIRPEHLGLASSLPATFESESVVRVSGQLFLVEHLGMHNLLSLHIHQPQSSKLILRALVPTDQTWSGTELTLAMSLSQIHWFDGQTGDRI